MLKRNKLSQEDQRVEEVLKKIEEVLGEATGEAIVIFTPEEAKALKKVAARERAWMGVGFLLNQYKTFLVYLGLIMGAYSAVKTGFAEGITKAFKSLLG